MRWGEYQHRLPTEDEVRAWWAQWPEANLGCATGKISGMVVLDADSADAISLVMHELGGLEDAPMVETGKGAHWYLAAPDETTHNSAGAIAPGVDYRGDGGFVLLPPSLHKSGKRYRWPAGEEVHAEYGPVPTWLDEKLAKSVDGEAPFVDNGDLLAKAEAGFGSGERDVMMHKVAARLRGDGVDYALARSLMLRYAAQCSPPFEEKLALQKLDYAWAKYPVNPPRVTDGWALPGQVAPAREAQQAEDQAPLGPNEYRLSDGGTYGFTNLTNFLASIDLESKKELVAGILQQGSVHWIFADPGTGKSLIAFQLGLHIALGIDVGQCEVIPGKVLVIEEDQGLDVTAGYLTDLLSGMGLDPKTDIPNFMITSPGSTGFKIQKPEDKVIACQMIEDMAPDLVIFDSCERVCPSKDYNSSEFQSFIDLFNHCRGRETAVIVIDHTNKSTEAKGSDKIIGGRSKSATADAIYQVTGDMKKDHVTLSRLKYRGAGTAKIDVFVDRNENDGMAFRYQWQATKPEKGPQRKVFDYLEKQGKPCSIKAMASVLTISKRTLERALSQLVVHQFVERTIRAEGRIREAMYFINTKRPLATVDNDADY